MFPRRLFEGHRWDENIFLGYEEAELCMRARRNGYRILQFSDMRVLDQGSGASTLQVPAVGRLTEYDLCLEAARLYVGVKRYRTISPSLPRLLAFLAVYAAHVTIVLLRNGALRAWPEVLRRSRIIPVRRNRVAEPTASELAGW
jgi:GT2 family glycosyltransferase